METIRLQASQSLDRFTRLSEREFDNTAEAWSLVTDANVKTLRALPGYRQFDDVSRLSDQLVELVARQANFADWEVNELLEKPKSDRLRYFIERNSIHELNDAKRAIGKASGHIARNALFIDRRIHSELASFLDWAWKALLALEIVREVRETGGGAADIEDIRRDDEDFRQNAEDKMKELEGLVRERFWPKPENS